MKWWARDIACMGIGAFVMFVTPSCQEAKTAEDVGTVIALGYDDIACFVRNYPQGDAAVLANCAPGGSSNPKTPSFLIQLSVCHWQGIVEAGASDAGFE